MAVRAEYTALRGLQVNGVWGYAEGDPVPAGAVENCGFVIGEDVTPSGLALLPMPARNASRATWAAYAADQGVPQDVVDGLTRDQLVAEFEEPDTKAEPAKADEG